MMVRGEPEYIDQVPRRAAYEAAHPNVEIIYLGPFWQAIVREEAGQTGEHAEARLTVPARAFDRYDEAAETWVRPSGEFTVHIGRSSADLPLHLQVRSP